MIGNFTIRAGSTQPTLQVQMTKDGFVDMNLEAPKPKGCGDPCAGNPNLVDLTNAIVSFQMFKCGRVPQEVAILGRTFVSSLECSTIDHEWDPSETANPGIYYGQFKVVFPDNTVLLWPYEREQLTIEVF